MSQDTLFSQQVRQLRRSSKDVCCEAPASGITLSLCRIRPQIPPDRGPDIMQRIVEARDGEIHALGRMLCDLRERQRKVWTFVNNHYEGCAPLTIQRIRERI